MQVTRRSVTAGALAFAVLDWRRALAAGGAPLTRSLTDLSNALGAMPPVTIYTAKTIRTLDRRTPSAAAVAVVNGRILAVGTLDEVKALVGTQPATIDTTFADKVIVPGFIAQHDHPVLAALTMSSEILAIEGWVLPTGTVKAVKDKGDFMARLAAAERKLDDPDACLYSWGYHEQFFGKLTRADLDTISATRPIAVSSRSVHELFLNSAALKRGNITPEVMAHWRASEQAQSNFAEGHFWEQGLFAVLPHVTFIATPERLHAGLELVRDYMHAKGVTFGCEPGGITVKPVQDAVNAVFAQAAMPFRWSFIVDGKTMADKYKDDRDVITQSEAIKSWYGGMTSLAAKQAKLFADGAIYSQAMQLREPYLDRHDGAWMTDLDVFQRAFRIYWDAGFQIHIHVNGDAGIDRVLDTLEANLRRNPRFDHRTTVVHFAVSAPDQVARIKRLGAIVSANPYYVTALADQYGKVGLGAARADQMVRLGDVERAGISWSLHSDMPMAPCDPLFLMWCAVNRLTASGRIAGADQRVSRETALAAVTINAAYSLRREEELGSITPGKRANFTILGDDPLTIDPTAIKDIKVWGTVMEGRVLPAGSGRRQASMPPALPRAERDRFAAAALRHAAAYAHEAGD